MTYGGVWFDGIRCHNYELNNRVGATQKCVQDNKNTTIEVWYAPKNILFLFCCTVDRFRKTKTNQMKSTEVQTLGTI